eukprot:Pgem_evm1s8978
MINSTATETALACTVCNKEVGMAHKCSQCNNYVHSFCSDHEQNQSLGIITRNKCHDDYCSSNSKRMKI